MTSYKSIFPMIVLIILSFLTPTRQDDNDQKIKDLKTCFHSLVRNCGSSNLFPAAEDCVAVAFMFWDEGTFSEVKEKNVKKILKNYYLSFAGNIDTVKMLGPYAYCDNMVTNNGSIEECRDQLAEFKNGPSGPEAQEGPSHIVIVERENSYDIRGYGDEIYRAIRFGLYHTKLLRYVNVPHANPHNFTDLLRRGEILQPRQSPHYFTMHYMLHISTNFIIENGAIKNPKDYCIEEILPQINDRLSNFEDARSFFFF